MKWRPDPQLADDLSAALMQEQSRIVAGWVALAREALPQVLPRLDASSWAQRVVETLACLQRELASPDRLRYPVLLRESRGVREITLSYTFYPAKEGGQG